MRLRPADVTHGRRDATSAEGCLKYVEDGGGATSPWTHTREDVDSS